MFPYDMPQDIGGAEWNSWFSRQPSLVKNQVVQAITSLTSDQSLPPSMTQGGYAPELDPQSAGLLGMGAAPVERNTKGQIQPYDLGVGSTTTNVLQDRNSYLIDNAAAMQAGPGAYSAEAFNPVYEPIGQPLQAPGAQLLDRYASSGGASWQSYIADAILNKGLDPASAQADLIRTITAPETATATPQEKAQRQALIDSLPGRAVKDPISGVYTMMAPDLKDIVNTVDTDKIFDWADKGYQQMATDPLAGYTDPATGLDYAGAKAQDSTAAKWYHDRGLSLPTDSYTDPKFIDQIAPVDPAEIAAWEQSKQNTATAADSALQNFRTQQDVYGATQRAFDSSQRSTAPVMDLPIGGGAGTMGVRPRSGGDQLPTTGLPWQPTGAPGIVAGQGGMRPPMAPGRQPFTPFQPPPDFQPSNLGGSVQPSPGRSMYDVPPPTWLGGPAAPTKPIGFPIEGTVSAPETSPGRSLYDVPPPEGLDQGPWSGYGTTAVPAAEAKGDSKGNKKPPKSAKDLGAGFMLGSSPNQDMVKAAFIRAEAARKANAAAIQARSAAQEAPDAIFQQAMAYMSAKKLQDSGRTRLGDQLAQRALAARAAGLYGYQ